MMKKRVLRSSDPKISKRVAFNQPDDQFSRFLFGIQSMHWNDIAWIKQNKGLKFEIFLTTWAGSIKFLEKALEKATTI